MSNDDITLEPAVKSLLGECLRKKRITGHHANLVIERAKKEGTILHRYRCPHCNGWHITKMSNHKSRL